jgi:hypothetical protein
VGGEFELGTMVTGPEYKDINALISWQQIILTINVFMRDFSHFIGNLSSHISFSEIVIKIYIFRYIKITLDTIELPDKVDQISFK